MLSPQDELESVRQQITQLSNDLQHARSRDESLEKTIRAAEACMKALRLTADPHEQAAFSARANRLVSLAERIKTSGDAWADVVRLDRPEQPRVVVRALPQPISTRKSSTKEKILLLRSSFLHGFKFPPWETAPQAEEFDIQDRGELFLDTPDLRLSDFQDGVFDGWKRPAEALPPPSWAADIRPRPTMHARGRVDLVQDAASDCSVVASLCVGIARVERGHPRISKTLLYPYDAENDIPVLSKNGKYVLRLNFNGCFRRVVVDDRLPTSSTERVLHVIDRRNPSLLWPALIEKGYLKARGGYDFPGSNSGTDIWIMTGWIPEQIFLRSDELDPDRLWRRIFDGFGFGDVLVTTGTGKITSETEEALGLVSEHDYAVLDLKETDGRRMMLIKNPWCDGPSWQRTGTTAETVSIADPVATDAPSAGQSVARADENDEKLAPGIFWMDLANFIQNFESVYLNWNPGLFKHRQDIHFAWDLTASPINKTSRGRLSSLRSHPQFTVTAETGGVVWIVLCRHFQNAVPADATTEQIEDDRFGVDVTGHVSLSAFAAAGRRVLSPDEAFIKGWLVDSPQTLLKLKDCASAVPYTIVPIEQDLPVINHTFTLSVFSNSPITLEEAIPKYHYSQQCSATWTESTSGGNVQYATYHTNPQFSVHITKRADVAVLLETAHEELNIHVKLVHGKGQRVHVVHNKEIVVDSKDYRHGYCVAEQQALDAGYYTIVCSTFEPRQLGAFTLSVEASEPIALKAIPKDGAGRVCVRPKSASFQPGQNRLALPLAPKKLAKLFVIAHYVVQSPAPPQSNPSLVRVSIEEGRGPNSRVLVVSGGGVYADVVAGVRTSDIDLGPRAAGSEQCWLIVDRMAVGTVSHEETVTLEIFVDRPDALEYGSWQAWDD